MADAMADTTRVLVTLDRAWDDEQVHGPRGETDEVRRARERKAQRGLWIAPDAEKPAPPTPPRVHGLVKVLMRWATPRALKAICPWCQPATEFEALYVFVPSGSYVCFGVGNPRWQGHYGCGASGRLVESEHKALLALYLERAGKGA